MKCAISSWGSPSRRRFMVRSTTPQLNCSPLATSTFSTNLSLDLMLSRQSCSLLPHPRIADPPTRGFLSPKVFRCASTVSANSACVKFVFFANNNPPLILLFEDTSPIQSSFAKNSSLRVSSSCAAMTCSVSWLGWTSAASASMTRTCEKLWGLWRYSTIILCFSQLKFSRSAFSQQFTFSRSGFLVLQFLSRSGKPIVDLQRMIITCPYRRMYARFVARIARTQLGRLEVPLPHSLRPSTKTVCARSIPPLGAGRASTTSPSSWSSHCGWGAGRMGRP
mmetsp:Transcript_92801/g.262691  ORF Transcript_92801/g.262691 Transcript_92801/m.262691 type:complete len:279 (-) Transcript_92801:442-1278(-)